MKWRENRQNEIQVQMEDVEVILDKDFGRLDHFLSNVFCIHCSKNITIRDYVIYLDDIHDLIFDGKCSYCHRPVARFIETGVSGRSSEAAEHIRVIKLKYKAA